MTVVELNRPKAQTWRSLGAVLAGLVAVVGLSTGVDQALHATGVYPPFGEPMHAPALFLLALGYRVAIQVFGGWLTARLAPSRPLRHALALGLVGAAAATAGAAATMGDPDLGPAWYPLALVVSALPSALLGGRLARR